MLCANESELRAELEPTARAAATDNPVCVYRVFLADDHEEMLRTVALILPNEFHIIGVAEDGQGVLKLVPELVPDVLLIDICMPRLNGIETVLRLKSSGCNAHVVFLTAHEDLDFVEAAMSAGIVGYVLKPYLCTDLVPAIRRVIDGNSFVSPSLSLRHGYY